MAKSTLVYGRQCAWILTLILLASSQTNLDFDLIEKKERVEQIFTRSLFGGGETKQEKANRVKSHVNTEINRLNFEGDIERLIKNTSEGIV